MGDVEMKDAPSKEAVDEAIPTPPGPGPIRVEDVARNVALIVRAVEANQARLTTRAITRRGTYGAAS